MITHDDHTRFDAGLTDDLLDLLSEDERERFHAHARGCERCTRRLAIALAAREDWWFEQGHIPESGLVAIAEDEDAFAGETRDLIEAHVAECATCREELAILRAGEPTQGALRRGPRPVPVRTARPSPLRWGLFGAIAGAAAACLFFLSAPPPPPPVLPPVPQAASSSRAAAPSLSVPVRVILASPTRSGAGAETTLVHLAPGSNDFSIVLPVLLLPDSTQCRLRLFDADGSIVSEAQSPAARLFAATGVNLHLAGQQVPHLWTLVLSWRETPTVEHERRYVLRTVLQ